MLEQVPHDVRFVDRSMVTSVLFRPKWTATKTVYPSRFWSGVRRFFGRLPEPARNIPVIQSGAQVEYTVAGGDRPFTITLGFRDDGEAEEIARWLRREPNKFEETDNAE